MLVSYWLLLSQLLLIDQKQYTQYTCCPYFQMHHCIVSRLAPSFPSVHLNLTTETAMWHQSNMSPPVQSLSCQHWRVCSAAFWPPDPLTHHKCGQTWIKSAAQYHDHSCAIALATLFSGHHFRPQFVIFFLKNWPKGKNENRSPSAGDHQPTVAGPTLASAKLNKV